MIEVRTLNQNVTKKETLMINTTDKIIKHKVGLLNLAEELGNVSKACKMMGLSRDTFYRYKSAVDEDGIQALFDQNRRKPNMKNRVDQHIEQAVIEYAVEYPAHGQHRTSNELRKGGVFVSGSGVRSVWVRHDLANFKSRLKALEAKVAQDGIVLTEKHRWPPLRGRSMMMRLVVRLRQHILATLAHKIHSTWAPSKALVAFISIVS